MRWVRLAEVCEVISGQSPSSSGYNKDGIGLPFFQGKADFGQLSPSVRNWTTEIIKLSNPNDILISVRAPVGPTNLNNVHACIGRGLGAIRAGEMVDTKFLLHYLRSIEHKIEALGNGSTFKAITSKELKNIEIPLPPLAEQRRIASLLDAADKLRQQDKALIGCYNALAQSVFLEMFGDPVRNERGWEVLAIEELCEKIVDCVNRTAPIVDYETQFKMIRTTNVRNYKINFQDLRYVTQETFEQWTRRLLPQRGDIIFTREAPAGEAAIVDFDDSIFLGQRTMHFRPDLRKVYSQYLLYQLMGADVQRQINEISSGSTVKHLSVPACKKFMIQIPPLSLQEKFAAIVENIQVQKRQAETSLAQSEALFQSLLQRAFVGDL